jgi:hypothetical protein
MRTAVVLLAALATIAFVAVIGRASAATNLGVFFMQHDNKVWTSSATTCRTRRPRT